MGTTTEPGERARPWLITAAAALAWACFTCLILHLVSGRNPVTDTLSSYAYGDNGGMLGASMLALAVGSLALLGALCVTGAVRGLTRLLLGTWSAGLATAALFPASYPDHPHPLSGEIHLYSCLAAFLSLPAVGFTLLDRFSGVARTWLGRLTGLSAAALGLFGVGYALPWLIPVGLVQRTALVADLVLLCGILVLVAQACIQQRATASLVDKAGIHADRPAGGGGIVLR
ncbi:DUF998 domain-containing protein [Amycolatopsis acidicola]|uniref:DUF998 domain-containing protein n=1 Tax=Amycolatopsis acidicola TaxID=2596893 RepID=A0A5N0VGY7_9PSEU|nr:DUF998 domain-containing protein [Amycolatopsis acidicola]KAA9164918.1 DUF998 domain-containing protein [Amycolatopsis acidicola]